LQVALLWNITSNDLEVLVTGPADNRDYVNISPALRIR
jgi:hypothetical protein